jgi:hypothetical protein
LATHRQHDEADATAIEVVYDPQKVGGAPGKSVRFGRHKGVISADEAQSVLQLITLGDGRQLFREDFFAAGNPGKAGWL